MDQYLIFEGPGPLSGSTARRYRFPNNYGASVVKGGPLAYGGHELAVLDFVGGTRITYDTPITDDVVGHLTSTSEADILQAIKDLVR